MKRVRLRYLTELANALIDLLSLCLLCPHVSVCVYTYVFAMWNFILFANPNILWTTVCQTYMYCFWMHPHVYYSIRERAACMHWRLYHVIEHMVSPFLPAKFL